MSHIINVSVKNHVATQTDKTVYVCGNDDFVINFDFDSEWDQYDTKTARFTYAGTYVDVVFTGNTCAVPVITDVWRFKVGVFAGNLSTTTPVLISASKSILCDAGAPAAPTDDVYNQIIALVDETKSLVNNVEDDITDINGNMDILDAEVSDTSAALEEYKDGFEKLNLWSKAELKNSAAYVRVIDGKLVYQNSDVYNSFIIPVDGAKKYIFGSSLRFAVPLEEDQETATVETQLAYAKIIDFSNYPNTKYLAFCLQKKEVPIVISVGDVVRDGFKIPNWAQTEVDTLQTEVDTLQTEVDTLQTEVDREKIDKCAVSKTGTFSASGDYILLPSARTNLRKGLRLVFEATATSGTDFEVGFSISESALTNTHNIISINANNITYDTVEYSHGLTVEGRVQLIFEYLSNARADITLLCNGNSFKQKVPFKMTSVAVPYAKSNGVIATDCKLSFICTDLLKKIWIFGDSYFAYDKARWTYYLNEHDYDKNVLIDGWPGMSSVNGQAAFVKMVKLAKPQYAVWFLGMNDGSDADDTTPSTLYSESVGMFISTCEENGITPILATIPNVPNINHKGKNSWVKASGYRYVDMCHAVGADVDANWYGDMLSGDNVHPSETGAKALFAQVLLDLPEIMLDN